MSDPEVTPEELRACAGERVPEKAAAPKGVVAPAARPVLEQYPLVWRIR